VAGAQARLPALLSGGRLLLPALFLRVPALLRDRPALRRPHLRPVVVDRLLRVGAVADPRAGQDAGGGAGGARGGRRGAGPVGGRRARGSQEEEEAPHVTRGPRRA